MAGSPRYLDLLNQIGDDPWNLTNYEPVIESLWRTLGKSRVDDQAILFGLAAHTFNHIALLSDRPLADVVKDAADLHIAKNAGYAGASNKDPWRNFRLSSKFHVPPRLGVLVRMSDKYIRWQNLKEDPTNERVGESILDTLRDFAAYALIAFCLGEERNPRPSRP